MIRGVINSNLFRNPRKVKVLLHVLCVEAISVLHMEEKVISADTKTKAIRDRWMHKHKGHVDAAQRQRNLTSFVHFQ